MPASSKYCPKWSVSGADVHSQRRVGTHLVVDQVPLGKVGDRIGRNGTVVLVQRVVGDLFRDGEWKLAARVDRAERDVRNSVTELLTSEVAEEDGGDVVMRVPLRHVDRTRSLKDDNRVGVLAGHILDEIASVIEKLWTKSASVAVEDLEEFPSGATHLEVRAVIALHRHSRHEDESRFSGHKFGVQR